MLDSKICGRMSHLPTPLNVNLRNCKRVSVLTKITQNSGQINRTTVEDSLRMDDFLLPAPSTIRHDSDCCRTSILDLPHEILNEIFSIVVSDHHARVEFYDEEIGWRTVAQVLLLSS